MRLFIALHLPKAYDTLKGLQDELRKKEARISYPKEFHLTLKFLGEVENPAQVQEQLQAITSKRFQVSLSQVGYFPNPRKPRVVWVGVEPAQPVIELQQRIDQALESLFPRDNRFHPHVTIGRVKHGTVTDFNPLVGKSQETIDRFLLMKSDLSPVGPKYSVLSEHILM